jgi:hypothetical protein
MSFPFEYPQFGANASMPKNDPRLMELVTVKVTKSFYANGRRVSPGELIELPRFDAESMAALKRVSFT